jgi:tetratricopeptide repeat protein
MMMNGVGGTAAVLTRESSLETARAAGNHRQELGRGSETASGCLVSAETAEPRGANDLHLASSLNHLARLCREQGEDGKAEPLLERALAIQEEMLGPTHPHVAITLTQLMYLYRRQGKETAAAAAAARATGILATRAREAYFV